MLHKGNMSNSLEFDAKLIARYDQSGPRYTSYPTAAQFTDHFNQTDYRRWANLSNQELVPKPLSLYIHIPFCDTICYYCGCNKVVTKDHSLAIPYLQDLFREIELQASLYDHDRIVEQLHWGGGTPTFLKKDQQSALFRKILESFSLLHDDSGDYSIEIDPRSVSPDIIHHLRNLGFNRLSLGVQDFDTNVQKAVNRIQPLEQTLSVIETARNARYKSINIDLIYGLPLQTQTSFSKTIDTLIETDPDRVALYNYAYLPKRFPPQRRININELPTPEEKLGILKIAINRLTSAGYIYIGMDHFAKPLDELAVAQRNGDLYRNFQGYSAHAECDLVAMGVSAISHIGNNFSQNTTNLKSYHASLSNNELPIIRGYELEADDLLRRDIIQQIICTFKLNVLDIERIWNISFTSYFSEELRQLAQMEVDGLVKIDSESIHVCARGRLLVRNICMVFDKYYQPKKTNEQYSRVV